MFLSKQVLREREREREGGGEGDRQSDRQTDRQTDRNPGSIKKTKKLKTNNKHDSPKAFRREKNQLDVCV